MTVRDPIPIIEGPHETDLQGNLDKPVKFCMTYEGRCKYFGVHDGHYFYCAAQDAENKHAKPGQYAYPWAGAGKQIRSPHPDDGCPYLKGDTDVGKPQV